MKYSFLLLTFRYMYRISLTLFTVSFLYLLAGLLLLLPFGPAV
jgi:hypothetical protein